MRFDLAPAPHLAPTRRVVEVMGPVTLALLPGALVHLWCFGPGLLLNLASAVTVALASERLSMRWLGHARTWQSPVGDGSALVTAVLIAFCLPPLTPVWVSAIASALAIVLAKQCFGGLGKNPFNPAMVGYAAVLLAFPAQLAGFPAAHDTGTPNLGQSLGVFLTGLPSSPDSVDVLTGATPLDRLQGGIDRMMMVSEIRAQGGFSRFGYAPRWDVLSLAFLLGGAWLLQRRIITWHAPAGVFGGVLLTASVLAGASPDGQASPLFHLAVPSTVLGAFFIATDPVSGATSPVGRLLFGLGVGTLTVLMRSVGAHPDGLAYAVLAMNLLVPLIDRWTRPRVVGNEQ